MCGISQAQIIEALTDNFSHTRIFDLFIFIDNLEFI